MLEEVRITALGVIEDAVLELSPGFTVVTGETGAGKTMVVTGLGLMFGGRADPARVRPGAERATVEGRLRIDPAGHVAQQVQRGGRRPRRRWRHADRQPFGVRRGAVAGLRGRPVGPGLAAHLPGRRPGGRARAGGPAAAAAAGPAAPGARPVRRAGAGRRAQRLPAGLPAAPRGPGGARRAGRAARERAQRGRGPAARPGRDRAAGARRGRGRRPAGRGGPARARGRAARGGDHGARGAARRSGQRVLRGGGRGHPARRGPAGAGGGSGSRPGAGRPGGPAVRGRLPGLRRGGRAGLLRCSRWRPTRRGSPPCRNAAPS